MVSNGRYKSYMAKNIIYDPFGAIFGPFGTILDKKN